MHDAHYTTDSERPKDDEQDALDQIGSYIDGMKFARDIRSIHPEVKGATYLVYLHLMMRCNPRAHGCFKCWPRIKRLMDDTGLTESTVRSACKKLNSIGLLKMVPHFDEHGQQKSNTYYLSVAPSTSGAPKQNTPPKNDDPLEKQGALKGKEKNNEEKRKGGAAKRGTRIPDDWKPTDADIEYAVKKGFKQKYVTGHMVEAFQVHYLSKAGREGVRLDWRRTWQSWVLKQIEFGGLAKQDDLVSGGDDRDRWKPTEHELGIVRLRGASDAIDRIQKDYERLRDTGAAHIDYLDFVERWCQKNNWRLRNLDE